MAVNEIAEAKSSSAHVGGRYSFLMEELRYITRTLGLHRLNLTSGGGASSVDPGTKRLLQTLRRTRNEKTQVTIKVHINVT